MKKLMTTKKKPTMSYFMCVAVFIALLMQLKLPNMGGSGLALPQNILAWAIMCCVTCAAAIRFCCRGAALTVNPMLCFYGVGTVLLVVPLFYTSSVWHPLAGWHLMALLGGWLFYGALLQLRIGKGILYMLLAAVYWQAFSAGMQFIGLGDWVPYAQINGRPYGVFQQVNLLASFIACGLGGALTLLLLPEFALASRRQEGLRNLVLQACVVLFTGVLVCLQSRIGWLGTAAALLLPLLCLRRYPRSACYAIAAVAAGLLLSLLMLQTTEESATRSMVMSNHARLAMLQTAWSMVEQRPWLGWGLGSFEYSFQHFRLAQGFSTDGLGVVTHPHNELLFMWVEAGVFGLLSMLLLIVGVGSVLWRSWCCWQKGCAELPLALCIIAFPLLLHSQTEYPFSLSAWHWALLLLLLAMADRLSIRRRRRISVNLSRFVGFLALPVALVGIVFMGYAMYGGLVLTAFERGGLRDIAPVRSMPSLAAWAHQERRDFDMQIYGLLMYNQTQNPRLLTDYTGWAKVYLQRHTDANVYYSLIKILLFQDNAAESLRWSQEASGLFPQDSRFVPQARTK
ncbi:Wzy polymerase domain-containing protein [Serratia sp. T13T92]|uniref:PglL family O-oligosaccharyltransferase n=1 Tax=Serratia sp. T13T92 TaxID=3397496 RepID=UPI0039DFC4C3